MNPGTFQGAGTGSALGTISRYIQTPTILTSQTIAVPPGTQRIEALLCGGGGGAGRQQSGGGGFGGVGVFLIPITGQPLVVTIGAGGVGQTATVTQTAGSPTYVTSGKIMYAAIGGGGAGVWSNVGASAKNGSLGGGGGGVNTNYNSTGGMGGGPPFGQLLWYAANQFGATSTVIPKTNTFTIYTGVDNTVNIYPTSGPLGAGLGGDNVFLTAGPQAGLNGCGGGGGSANSGFGQAGGEGGGGGGATNTSGSASAVGGNGSSGGGGGSAGQGTSPFFPAGGNGGSLASVSIWGYTGFAGGVGTAQVAQNWINAAGGGGGMLSAGSNGSTTFSNPKGGDGGLGGGGGGGGGYNYNSGSPINGDGGAGGNGFAVFRFYL